MPRVVCVICHDEGFTASPEYVKCACGGRLTVIKERNENEKQYGVKNERGCRDDSPACLEQNAVQRFPRPG